jgi:hypothetical protein
MMSTVQPDNVKVCPRWSCDSSDSYLVIIKLMTEARNRYCRRFPVPTQPGL